MNFLQQHHCLVLMLSTMCTVFGTLVLLQNVLLHCHETIKAVVVQARFSADTNVTNGMVPLLVTQVNML